MEKSGLVVKVEDKLAFVSVIRPSECGDKCDSCSGSCNIQSMVVQVENTLAAQVGDQVELKMLSANLVRLSFLMYTVPLVAFVIGVVVGYSFAPNLGLSSDLLGLAGGFMAMVLAYVGINGWMKSRAQAGETILSMVRCYRKGEMITN